MASRARPCCNMAAAITFCAAIWWWVAGRISAEARLARPSKLFQARADGFKQLDNGGPTGFDSQDYVAKLGWRTKGRGRDPASYRTALQPL